MINKNGFTLIEVIIYIALFSLLMGTAFITAYQLIDGTSKLNTKTVVQEEGNFVMRKLNWDLTGLDSTVSPIVDNSIACSNTLRVEKVNFSMNPIRLRLNSNALEISENEGTYVPITTTNVKVTCLKFSVIPPFGSGPSGLSATTTISETDFAVTKYQRI